jgi:hypothetical protein
MPFEIKRDHPTPRIIKMGQGAEAPKTMNEPKGEKMEDKKLDEEAGGPDTIRKDDAGDEGAIGSGGKNAPAQEKAGQGKGNKEK